MAPAVTIVVATRDRTALLERTLTALARFCPGTPVVVCDDGSDPPVTDAISRRYDGVVVLRGDRPVGAAVRNTGVGVARTPLVAFCDDDSWWCHGALLRAATCFAADERLGLLAARVLVGPELRLDPVCASMRQSPLERGSAGPAVIGFVACAAVVRRDAFLNVGGFPDRYGIGGEEQPLAIALARAGWSQCYADDVVARHVPPLPGPMRADRAAITLRNDLWTAWSCRAAATAVRRTVHTIRRAGRDPVARRALVGAARGAPWALRRRVPPGRGLERRLRRIERQPRSLGER